MSNNLEDLQERLTNVEAEIARFEHLHVDPHVREHREAIRYRDRLQGMIANVEERAAERERVNALPASEVVARIPR